MFSMIYKIRKRVRLTNIKKAEGLKRQITPFGPKHADLVRPWVEFELRLGAYNPNFFFLNSFQPQKKTTESFCSLFPLLSPTVGVPHCPPNRHRTRWPMKREDGLFSPVSKGNRRSSLLEPKKTKEEILAPFRS
ncbi:hypothetical protein E1A91_A04G026500v1 [Gossypium mustelinum]|uniref:Uncharacterized protein n=1 Tax=Gossypium mustelinum TaxID=34275 RepID=A0A5D2ZJS3_GOSMU|nr:hypothetical protein E1A91_A04G026500v1 [Gossypium mustelinum]